LVIRTCIQSVKITAAAVRVVCVPGVVVCESMSSDGVVYPTRAAVGGLVSAAGNSYHSMELTVASVMQTDMASDMPRY